MKQSRRSESEPLPDASSRMRDHSGSKCVKTPLVPRAASRPIRTAHNLNGLIDDARSEGAVGGRLLYRTSIMIGRTSHRKTAGIPTRLSK